MGTLLVLWTVGCAGQAPRPPPVPGEDGTIKIVARDRLAWPYELSRLIVVLDGQPLYIGASPEQEVIWVGAIRAARGEHTMQVLAEASYASGTLGHRCHVRWRDSRTFVSGRQGASLLIDVHVRDRTTEAFPQRLGVSIVERGTEPFVEGCRFPQPNRLLTARSVHRRAMEQKCAPLSPPDNRLCQADVRVEEARRQRDVVALNCYQNKQTQMRALERIMTDALSAESSALDEAEIRHQSAKIAIAMKRIEALWSELENCVSEVDVYDETWWSASEMCSGMEPMPADSSW